MGRGHLTQALLAGATVALLVAAAPAAAGRVRWREVARGAAPGAPVQATTAVLALDRAAAARLARRLPAAARARVQAIDLSRQALVAVFGEFGCRDARIAVSALVQRGRALAVRLVERPLRPGTAECMAIFGTFRVLAVPRSSLGRPYPTRATVSLARA